MKHILLFKMEGKTPVNDNFLKTLLVAFYIIMLFFGAHSCHFLPRVIL